MLRDRRDGGVIGDQAAGAEVRSGCAEILVLRLVAPLHDGLRVEVRARRVVAGLVDRQTLGQLLERVHVPGDFLAVEDVRVTVRVRRVLETGLVEHVAMVEQH